MGTTTDEELAAGIIAAVGGAGNVREVDQCFLRLRLVLADRDAVDQAAVEALPGVVMAFHQAGQYQVVLGARVRGVTSAVRALVDVGR